MREARIVAAPELTADAIRAAAGAIDPVFTDSPQFVHDGLTARLGVPVVVKVETVNPIRSFKGRGTWVAVHGLAGEGRIGPERPVVVRVGRQLRAGRRLRGSGARRTGRRVHVAQREPRPSSPGCGPSARRSSSPARTSTTPGRRPRRTPTEHAAELLVDGDDPRISTGAATLALEVDRRDRGGRPARAGGGLGPGRQRRAHQRRRVVAARMPRPARGWSASRPRAPTR